jgi:hypothetical protein
MLSMSSCHIMFSILSCANGWLGSACRYRPGSCSPSMFSSGLSTMACLYVASRVSTPAVGLWMTSVDGIFVSRAADSFIILPLRPGPCMPGSRWTRYVPGLICSSTLYGPRACILALAGPFSCVVCTCFLMTTKIIPTLFANENG